MTGRRPDPKNLFLRNKFLEFLIDLKINYNTVTARQRKASSPRSCWSNQTLGTARPLVARCCLCVPLLPYFTQSPGELLLGSDREMNAYKHARLKRLPDTVLMITCCAFCHDGVSLKFSGTQTLVRHTVAYHIGMLH